jgi:hypothetical protein
MVQHTNTFSNKTEVKKIAKVDKGTVQPPCHIPLSTPSFPG